MIVTATRGDLRDEFSMADEAFALSPITARATLPGEADYDAIREAFMETSRGRWFLSEYTKRNRNADTRMVLDAVAQIEENLAAQKNAAPESGLAEALAVIRDAVDEARIAAAAALDSLAVEESLAPIRKGAKVIREVLLRLREIGADGRIYDLIDSQVGVIETGCGQFASTEANAALSAAFDLIDQRIKDFENGDAAQQPAVSETPASSSATAANEAAAARAETSWPSEIESEDAAAAALTPEDMVATAQTEAAVSDTETELDDAVLNMIALEMAAPDFDEPASAETYAVETAAVEPDMAAQTPEIVIASEPKRATPPQPSLGASLIANGIVRRPETPAVDPLAPIRRMSQAEKIAFFS
jgi:hypothetical protein